MRVFLSWSGPTSKAVATALYELLPAMIQQAKPWMSGESIQAGERWANEVEGELEKSNFGIVCLTPTNIREPWLNFESGALGKVASRSKVIPYLLGLEPTDVTGPLSQFQMMRADEAGTWKLFQSLNGALPDAARLAEKTLERLFGRFWPELDDELRRIAASSTDMVAPVAKRTTEEMLDELLELARAQERRTKELEDARNRRTLDRVRNQNAHNALSQLGGNAYSDIGSALAEKLATMDSIAKVASENAVFEKILRQMATQDSATLQKMVRLAHAARENAGVEALQTEAKAARDAARPNKDNDEGDSEGSESPGDEPS
jgi:hypothetical protein